jgi:hypothetical protein
MELAAPFPRRGYTVDLAASDRADRRLAFRPIEVAAVPGRHPVLRCRMCLEQPHRALIRLTRTLESPDGCTATVIAEGDDPGALLDAVERVDPARQLHTVSGVMLSRSYRIALWVGEPLRRRSARNQRGVPWLTRAEASFGEIRLVVADEERRPLEIRLVANNGCRLYFTEDLLAVLGWSWRPLRQDERGTWWGSVKPPAREPKRTARLEAMLDKTVVHLVQTLATVPIEFHWRHKGARWRAAFQRLLPLLIGGSLAIVFVVLVLVLPKTILTHMIMLDLSIAGIVAMALMDKSYRMEIPPIPRPLTQAQWCSPAARQEGG